jgi:hypothetical protein
MILVQVESSVRSTESMTVRSAKSGEENGGSMISVIKTTSGNYNVIGTADDAFIIQGNLTKSQLQELLVAISLELKKG